MPADRAPVAAGPFVMLGDDAALCVDGVCAVPPAPAPPTATRSRALDSTSGGPGPDVESSARPRRGALEVLRADDALS